MIFLTIRRGEARAACHPGVWDALPSANAPPYHDTGFDGISRVRLLGRFSLL